jgi:dienelactone hydrolase
MNRREFLHRSASTSLALGLAPQPVPDPTATGLLEAKLARGAATSPTEATLPGTTPLTTEGDIARQMVEGIHKFLLQKTSEAPAERSGFWKRDYRSPEDYNRSISANRGRLRTILGAVDERAESTGPELLATAATPAEIARAEGYTILAVRWNVLDKVDADSPVLSAEGLLVQPGGQPVARVVAIPDADWTPEMLLGLEAGVPPEAQFARKLAESGWQVLIPALINRDDTYSGVPGINMTNLTHREWIYRMAFEAGRHIIGYEVQKVLAAVDWFANENGKHAAPIGVMGYGEGGMLALYSAALDQRIAATVVSGYFQPRENLWQEPIYRDVWGLVREFGDAELAGMIAPRALIVEACRGPEVSGPPPITAVHLEGACPNGTLKSPPLDAVKKELERARPFFAGLYAESQLRLVTSDTGRGLPGSDASLNAFLQRLRPGARLRYGVSAPNGARKGFDPDVRLKRQFEEMAGWTQAVIRKSPERRKEFWSEANLAWPDEAQKTSKEHDDPARSCGVSQWSASAEHWKRATQGHRDYIWTEVIGRVTSPTLPPNARTRLIYDAPKFTGYEVMLDVWPGVFAYGILLLPKDIHPGERRPVVVCQHGLEGRPLEAADPNIDSHYYHHFAARLADEGFVTYAPQNPYIGKDQFRIIQRMGHPLKLALFSFILGQHEQTLKWLAAQSFVDGDRIGFYGLSYGGKTAVRVAPLIDSYALSICSADFNDWVWKTTNIESHYSYLLWGEYDMYEFNFANVVNYAELANLMAPRPFMVERGHYDPVAPDSRVALEYAKVRWFYAYMGIPGNTAIEFFAGPHEIHGVGTFEFLRRHLRRPMAPSK